MEPTKAAAPKKLLHQPIVDRHKLAPVVPRIKDARYRERTSDLESQALPKKVDVDIFLPYPAVSVKPRKL